MDLHNLVMKTNEDGSRTQGPVPNWLEWCEQTDTLQMNESEISVLPGKTMHEYETAEKILGRDKVKAVIVTRGKMGVSLYQKKEKISAGEKYFELDKIDLPAIETPDFIDSTGCGDVFAASFFLRNNTHGFTDLRASLNYANKAASRNSTLFGVEDLSKIV
jgi:sugar/nucleoside kinase (ribokinase family)